MSAEPILTDAEKAAFHQVNQSTDEHFDDEITKLANRAKDKIASFVQMYIDEANLIKSIAESAEKKTLEGEELKQFDENFKGLIEVTKTQDSNIESIIKSDDFHPDFKRFIIQRRIDCHNSINRLNTISEAWHAREAAIAELSANE